MESLMMQKQGSGDTEELHAIHQYFPSNVY